MTLEQLKAFIVAVLKGWFTNKSALDKISESEDGHLLFDSKEITGGGSAAHEDITEEEMSQAIEDTLAELNAVEEAETEVAETDIESEQQTIESEYSEEESEITEE